MNAEDKYREILRNENIAKFSIVEDMKQFYNLHSKFTIYFLKMLISCEKCKKYFHQRGSNTFYY